MAELKVIEASDSLTHIAVVGRLDLEGVHAVELRFTTQAAARRRPTLVDLSELEFIASLGMGMLLRTAKALDQHKVRMVLVQPQELVERALRASSLDKVIPIAADLEQAHQMLQGG
jgi:anti-anti-sigma factor